MHACVNLVKNIYPEYLHSILTCRVQELAAALAAAQEKEEGGEGEKRPAIYNVEAIHDKLEDVAWSEDRPWDETLAVTSSAPTAVVNVDDDLERELAFYNQALEAAKTAIGRFEEAGLTWQRPPDYYAEMVKSDEHMAKVKEQLLFEQKQIEESEKRWVGCACVQWT